MKQFDENISNFIYFKKISYWMKNMIAKKLYKNNIIRIKKPKNN